MCNACAASTRTSATECAQPGLPSQALTANQGEFSSNTRPNGASTRSAASATASSRSQTSTDRHGVTTSGASTAARYSATRADSTPSGTAAPNVTRPSSCWIQPTGGRVTGAKTAPSSMSGHSAVASAISVTRQAFPRTSANLHRDLDRAFPRRRHPPVEHRWCARLTAGRRGRQTRAHRRRRTDLTRRPRPSSRLNQNRPPSSVSRGSAQIAASSSRPMCPYISVTAGTPGQRRRDDVAAPAHGLPTATARRWRSRRRPQPPRLSRGSARCRVTSAPAFRDPNRLARRLAPPSGRQ